YASTLAYSFYGILLIGAFIGSVIFQNKKYKKEKAILESTHLEEQEKKEFLVQQSKEKIDLLERQKLETEVKFKNQELAAATMNLLQKSQMLTSIEASLEKLKKSSRKKEDVYGEIDRLLKLVKKENSLSGEWERFSKHFDHVHSDFLKRLGERYPNLSPNDFKLSAYLKMNLSTKEIASLMNISIRGVEASRYRLRKRLQLDSGINLTEFLMKL
ncbi:MAG: two component regulator three y domain-containing protein, partial [Bacteroidota bacterium]